MKIKVTKGCRFCIIVLVCIGINCIGRVLADTLQLPVWLDIVGTCLAAYYTNLYGAILAGTTVNLIVGIWNPISLAYVSVGIMLACILRFCAKKGYLDELTPAMISSFVAGVLTVVAATPLDICFNRGLTGNMWGDALYHMLQFKGYPKMICTLADESILNIIDKQICVFLAYLLIRHLNKKNDKKKEVDRNAKGLYMMLTGTVCVLSVASAMSQTVHAAEEKYINFYDYEKVIYNNTAGLPSSEANAVAETEDGYIWIGGYAGLTRYDGTRFDYITEGGLSNVTEMAMDQRGRLWIGTNDHGVAIYDHGTFSFLTKEDGLPGNSVTALLVDKNGNVYVGTTDEIVCIDKEQKITVIAEKLNTVVSLAENNEGMLVALNRNGTLFLIENHEIIGTFASVDKDVSYSCVAAIGNEVYVGTTGGYVVCMQVQRPTLQRIKKIPCYLLSTVTRIQQDRQGVIWLCGDNGLGYLDETNRANILKYSGFDSSVEGMLQDYEGNYWFASSRFGVMKLCKNIFVNIYENSVLEGTVVNAVTEFQGKIYCATDTGLQIIEPVTRKVIRNQLADRLENERIRFLRVDSKNRLWICCYGGEGLICYNANGTIKTYNTENSGTAGDRFRCMLELSDGTIVAGSSEGLTFIEDGKVTDVLTEADGLTTTQILSLAEGDNGIVYAGSDGAGIYMLKDGKLLTTLTEKDGLSSLVILRMTPYKNGYFVVTSNSLSYMENNQIRKIDEFPYFNNYDIIIHKEKAWILSSRGIFVTDPENLLSGEKVKYQLYDQSNGMRNSITANSWTYIDEANTLYFCTNNGVETISMIENQAYSGNYKMQIGNFTVDGVNVMPEDGIYTITSGAERISITPSICNYTLTDLKVCAYIAGLDSKPSIVRQSALETLTYTNIPHGTYTLHLQIYDNSEENVVQETTYTIIKQAELWETAYFNTYLVIVLIWIGAFATWIIHSIRQMVKRKEELAAMSVELEKRVNEQTAEIKAKSKKMEEMQWGVIESMASLIESRDGNTGEHVRNTSTYVRMLATEMNRRNLYPDVITRQFIKVAAKVAPLHDVGKIKISDVILNKPGRFTPEEFEIMKTHAALGGEIVDDILDKDADPYLLQMARDIATYHHEKWDGSGYPYGLKGTDIPIAARIMAVADVFDALVSKRVYKDAMDIEDAFAEISRCAGTHFDAEIAQIFIEMKQELTEYVNSVRQKKQ